MQKYKMTQVSNALFLESIMLKDYKLSKVTLIDRKIHIYYQFIVLEKNYTLSKNLYRLFFFQSNVFSIRLICK